jgi:hypothetical protein
MQVLSSVAETGFDVLLGRWKSGHEVLFEYFLRSISEDAPLPYSPEEAYEATKTFLEVIGKLTCAQQCSSAKN